MIQIESFYNISYGLYIVSSGNMTNGNGFICNTVFQVTSEPAQFAMCCNKNNYTAELIIKQQAFAISILQQETDALLFGRFGYKSGRDTDKLQGLNIISGETGVPIIINDSIAYLECTVLQTIDMGTHLMFIGKLIQAIQLDDTKVPLTYDYYRTVKKGVTPKNAPSYIDKSKFKTTELSKSSARKYKCESCGYIYDDAEQTIPFIDLASDWICPICGSEKSDFTEIS